MQKFNYHSHTYRCGHAEQDMSDEEYVLDYIKMGFEKVAITDHCPEKNKIDKRHDMRMNYSQKNEYLDSIKKLQEKYKDKIKIETGFEVEYLPGEEENIKELKEEVDKIVLGQHFVYDDNKNLKVFRIDMFSDKELERYGEYIEKAMSLGIPDIVAHPDIFMLGRNGFGEKEAEVTKVICKASEKYNIPLEINLNDIFHKTYRENKKLNNDSIEKQKEKLYRAYYPCRQFWEIATNYNIKVLYGIDAHFRGQIPLFNELVLLANEIIGEDTIKKLDFIEEL